ncbi:hypothetical protein HCJ58_10105 [Listeria sp. FSL L7-1509]|uniref:Uncharacterized protein n=1 Tax=Listeria immobilis TaxID=2713502 RepID=A0ABR6SZ14_9LIST|nr:hypothetical protein [Listeria immobilis]MBC1481936.1 hypothetical protein [Listeria immobilis]MBC1507311.1 hypothetical protein [Listeria immobilis]MBC1510623.1 hypothetical protein [Listeria immobilis]MBC6313171.1 hypothetical protein [Listeria immobilis]
MGDDVVKDLNEKIESNNANWAIPIVTFAVGSLPIIGMPISVMTTAGDVGEAVTEDEKIKAKIKMENLKSTADTFKMTLSIQTIHQENPLEDMVNIDIQPTKGTRDILGRWKKKSETITDPNKGGGSFPKAEISSGELDYVELYKRFQDAEFDRDVSNNITEGIE